MDVFLCEGRKSLFRHGLGIIKLFKRQVLKSLDLVASPKARARAVTSALRAECHRRAGPGLDTVVRLGYRKALVDRLSRKYPSRFFVVSRRGISKLADRDPRDEFEPPLFVSGQLPHYTVEFLQESHLFR